MFYYGKLGSNFDAIEERLGVRLINRTTRTLDHTEIGARFYFHCRQIMPTFLVGEDLRSGRLRDALPGSMAGHMDRSHAIYAVHPHDPHVLPNVRSFVDFRAARFGQETPNRDRAKDGRDNPF